MLYVINVERIRTENRTRLFLNARQVFKTKIQTQLQLSLVYDYFREGVIQILTPCISMILITNAVRILMQGLEFDG